MAASIFRFADDSRPDENAIAVYFSIGSVGIFVLAALYFMGNVHEHYLRHLGFLLVIGTIVGSFALIRIISTMSSRQGHRLAVTAVVIFFAVLLPLSLATLYPSPFIYKQSQHVTETNMAGYQTVFDTNDESLPLGGIRDGPHRYSDALLGVTPGKRYTVGVTDENLTRLTGFYPDGGYVIVTEYDEAREVEAYKEIRYNESSFRAVERQQNVNQVVSNGELKLFHVSEGAG